MGLFSRKKSAQKTSSSSRSATSSEAQAAELRARARRRLIGALVLVLTAVIVVPMMFDEDIDPQKMDTPVVLPAIVPPAPEPDQTALVQPDDAIDEPMILDDPYLTTEPVGTDSDATDDTITLAAESPPTAAQDTLSQGTVSAPPTPAETVAAESPKPKPEPSAPVEPRTDDGSRALALLEGRVPAADTNRAQASPQTQGSFVLQIAAYSAEKDAEARRTRLIDAGVTNAYVEKGVSNDKTTYRLRVGSFPTRDAATAAQARLRALGYDNSMLLAR